jgi:hypothetical protein
MKKDDPKIFGIAGRLGDAELGKAGGDYPTQ